VDSLPPPRSAAERDAYEAMRDALEKTIRDRPGTQQAADAEESLGRVLAALAAGAN
jgi:hypothetical protein